MQETNQNNNNGDLKEISPFQRRLKRRRRVVRSFEAKINAQRTLAEKFADLMTARFGSVLFLMLNAVWFAVWIAINTGQFPAITVFDPFPFGLLTMIVSLEAIFLAIIVLISQNRSAKIADLREEIALQIDTIAEEEVTKVIELQVMLLKEHGIDMSHDPDLEKMLKPTDTREIELSLEKQMKK